MPIAIAMVMCRDDVELSGSDIQRELGARWPELAAATELEEHDGTIGLRVGASDVVLGKMPGPVPWSDLEGACSASILWPNASDEVPQHKVHWIVTVRAEVHPLQLALLLTQASAAAMAACPGALGVYWVNARMVIPKGIFIDFAERVLPLGPPLDIWVDFRIGRDTEKTTSGYTSGMAALGHMELEAELSPEPPGELRQRFSALARYLLENGPVIKDGDTIGEDEHERIRVVYSDSAFGHDGKVMRLQYEKPSPQKPWWKLW
jgi:hypothetical protein